MAETIKIQNLTPEFSRVIKVYTLRNTVNHEFDETPTETEHDALGALYDVVSVRKMRFKGEILPFDKDGWLLEGTLGATITQNCVITLERVRTRIDLDIRRIFTPTTLETETTIALDYEADDETEPLGNEIDLGLIAIEALALAIPEYPRVEGAELDQSDFSPDDTAPIEEEKAKPFAGLAALKEKLSNTDD